jgi:choline monooxygenase
VLAAVYPTHVLQLQPDWLWYLVLSPVGVGRVHIRWSVAIAPEVWSAEPHRDELVAGIVDLIDSVNAEDRPVIEGVWKALHHHDAARGPFSYLERNVYDIDRYVASRVTRPN